MINPNLHVLHQQRKIPRISYQPQISIQYSKLEFHSHIREGAPADKHTETSIPR